MIGQQLVCILPWGSFLGVALRPLPGGWLVQWDGGRVEVRADQVHRWLS